MLGKKQYLTLFKHRTLFNKLIIRKNHSNNLLNRQVWYLSNLEEIEAKDEDSADAFPMNSLIPEDLLRDLSEKKRMRKLEPTKQKQMISFSGIFPELVIDSYFIVDDKINTTSSQN